MQTITGTFHLSPRGEWIHTVEIDGRPLAIEPSWRICKQSYGFNWGYYGSGPSQLALALMLTCVEDEDTAWCLAGSFKEEVVSTWPYNASFTYPGAALHHWVARKQSMIEQA